MKIAFVNDSCQRLGLQYISAVLKASGHQTKLFLDPQLFDDEFISFKRLNRLFDYKKRLISDLKAYKPGLIGISVVTDFYQWACTMAKMIKQEMDVPIIFGGIHPTSVPERVIRNDFVDMVCVGEGEYPMLELANSMEKGQVDYSIKNIWFKRNGQIIQNEVRPLIEDLDELPFPDQELYYQVSPHFTKGYYITASRGCPYVCSYCCHSYLHQLYKGKGKYLRQRSVKNVMDELVMAKNKHKIKLVIFLDDCFGHDINWLKEFSNEYKEKVAIRFHSSMYPSDISIESARYLKEAGCCEVELGIQTWDEKVRDNILNRKVSNALMLDSLHLIRNEKISLVTGELLGIPDQEDASFVKAAEIYSKIRPNRSYFFTLKYYPNTAITKKAMEQGIIKTEDREKVSDGLYGKQLAKGGDVTDKRIIRFILLFFLIRILPKRSAEFILKKKLYYRFPTFFTPTALAIFNNLVSSNVESRLNRLRAFYRYSYFIKNMIR